jgi:hypothetical protein
VGLIRRRAASKAEVGGAQAHAHAVGGGEVEDR